MSRFNPFNTKSEASNVVSDENLLISGARKIDVIYDESGNPIQNEAGAVGLSVDIDGQAPNLDKQQQSYRFEFENWLLNNAVGIPAEGDTVPAPRGYDPRKTLAYEYRSPTMVRWFFVDFVDLPDVGVKLLESLYRA